MVSEVGEGCIPRWGLYSKVVAEIKALYSKVGAQVRIVLGDPA